MSMEDVFGSVGWYLATEENFRERYSGGVLYGGISSESVNNLPISFPDSDETLDAVFGNDILAAFVYRQAIASNALSTLSDEQKFSASSDIARRQREESDRRRDIADRALSEFKARGRAIRV